MPTVACSRRTTRLLASSTTTGAATSLGQVRHGNIQVQTGTVHIEYGGQANKNIKADILSLRPMVSGNDDVVWLCGYNDGNGMTPALIDKGAAASKSDISPKYVPASCRIFVP